MKKTEMASQKDIQLATFSYVSPSAILYLNEDFEGGKFFFAHSTTNLRPQVCSCILIFLVAV